MDELKYKENTRFIVQPKQEETSFSPVTVPR